jgi:DNA-binding transcriptional regulator YhcF (GntR family)
MVGRRRWAPVGSVAHVIPVDGTSSVPPYEQVRLGVAERIRSGELPPGTRLPSVRSLAEDLGLAANTVARAYKELEAAGLVRTAGRNGTVVQASGDRVRTEAARAAAAFAGTVRRLGLGPDESLALVRAALAAGPEPSARSPRPPTGQA